MLCSLARPLLSSSFLPGPSRLATNTRQSYDALKQEGVEIVAAELASADVKSLLVGAPVDVFVVYAYVFVCGLAGLCGLCCC